jgi:tRNA nucleotidyltransferase (CCA-adding enzyme)
VRDNLTNHPLIQHIAKVLPPQAELFVVGGAVRDALLNRPVTDLDLMVRGVAMGDLMQALRKLGEVDASGENWGVLGLTLDGKRIDVALPREEIQKNGDGHYFDVQVTADPNLPITDDLRRRDFTINAMALDVQTGKLVDPFHGQVDVQHRTLRTVGNPVTRFSQDHSRILRCLRFATQLGFTIEPITWEGLRTVVQQVGQLKIPKRIWEQEFAKAEANLPTYHEWLRRAGIERIHG